MNESCKRFFARVGPLLLMAGLCAAALLYRGGAYDLSFIDRETEAEVTRSPAELALESQLAAMQPGETIGSLSLPTTPAAGETTAVPPETAAPETSASGYPALDVLLAQGYTQSTADWDEGLELAEMDFAKADYPLPDELVVGEKVIPTYTTYQYDEDGERFPQADSTEVTRYGVELYGGYIFADLGREMIALARTDGSLIGRYSVSDLTPAYTRDREGRALFCREEIVTVEETTAPVTAAPVTTAPDTTPETMTEPKSVKKRVTVYYYLDDTGALHRSDYDPELDGRGLNFDYNADYGQSDSNIDTFTSIVTETLTDTIDRTNWYILGSVKAELAEPIYRIDPVYAEKVASRNPAFKAALAGAKVRVEAERAAAQTVMGVTESGDELLLIDALDGSVYGRVLLPALGGEVAALLPKKEAALAEETTAASVETTAAPIETTAAPVETTAAPVETTAAPVETTAAPIETTAAPIETTAAPVETTAAPVETTAAPIETTAAPVETTAPTEETTAPTEETTAPAPEIIEFPGGSGYLEGNNIVLNREVTHAKWGFTYDTGWRLTYASYLRTYAPSEGFGAAIDTSGRLIFVGKNGYRALPTKSWTNEWVYLTNENSRYVAASYVAPLYPDLRSLGHLYFDRGYVRVRELERDYSYRESVTADRELLIDTTGNEFEIPEGYSLAGYSDGVLLLERDGKYGYYSVAGHWIAQPVYTYAQPFLEGLGVIGFADGRCGVIDTEGRIVLPFVYDYISAPSSGLLAAFREEEGWSVFAKVKAPA